MRTINKIIVHCSASEWGDLETIRGWHVTDNGWSDVGYHYVIENCYPTWYSYKHQKPAHLNDGALREGRPIERVGAHAKGENPDSIGICLVGNETFTGEQIRTLLDLFNGLLGHYDLTTEDIYGHREFSSKTCPNIDSDWLREMWENYKNESS